MVQWYSRPSDAGSVCYIPQARRGPVVQSSSDAGSVCYTPQARRGPVVQSSV